MPELPEASRAGPKARREKVTLTPDQLFTAATEHRRMAFVVTLIGLILASYLLIAGTNKEIATGILGTIFGYWLHSK